MNKNQIVCILKMEYLAVLGNVCLSDSQEQFCSIFCPVNLILELDISSYIHVHFSFFEIIIIGGVAVNWRCMPSLRSERKRTEHTLVSKRLCEN